MSCLTCEEGLSLQATSPNAARVLLLSSGATASAPPPYARCRILHPAGYSLALPICQVVLVAGLVAVPFRRQFGERRIKLLRRQRQLATQQRLKRGEACQDVLFQQGSGVS